MKKPLPIGVDNYKDIIENNYYYVDRPDIVLRKPRFRGKSVIIEIKIAKTFAEMEEKCEEALKQIKDMDYDRELLKDGYQPPLKLGVCFFRKGCIAKK